MQMIRHRLYRGQDSVVLDIEGSKVSAGAKKLLVAADENNANRKIFIAGDSDITEFVNHGFIHCVGGLWAMQSNSRNAISHFEAQSFIRH